VSVNIYSARVNNLVNQPGPGIRAPATVTGQVRAVGMVSKNFRSGE